MKRSEIVEKLIGEGLSEKTLVRFSDKQLIGLAERMLGEQMNTQNSNQPQVTANVNDPNFNQVMSKLKQSGVKNINVTEEDEIEEAKKKKKKPTIYDKALKDLGGEEGVIKFLETGKKPKKKKDVNEVDMGLSIKSTPKSTTSTVSKPKPSKTTPKKKEKEVEDNEEGEIDESIHGIMIAAIKDKLSKKLGREPEDHELEHEHNSFIDSVKKEIESKKEEGKKKEEKTEDTKKTKGSKEVKSWVNGLVETELFHNFTSKNEIMELIQVKLNENQPAPSKPERETPVREKPSTRPERPKRENPFEPKHTPKPKALGEEGEEGQIKAKPKMPEFMKFKNLGFKFKDQK